MKDIKETIYNLRVEINTYRKDRGQLYISADILAVEIAMNLVEFALKKQRKIEPNEEIWFHATYAIAYSVDGTQWENIYLLYKDLINYVNNNNYFRNSMPINW